MFHLPAPVALRQLIHHDLPATGGASGSPIVGPNGKVVALLNAGNIFMVDGRRIPNAVLVNFAQRADLVRDMLEGKAEEKLVAARQHWSTVAESFLSLKDFRPDKIVQDARPADGMAPRLIVDTTRKMNAKSGKRVAEENADLYLNFAEIPLKLSPGADYLFLIIAEGGGGFAIFVDGKLALQAKSSLFPFIGCRLLTPAQQNTGDPGKPRAGCAISDQREAGMRLTDPANSPRDVELVLINQRPVTDPLAGSDLTYTVRVYQWVPARQSSLQ
jgi:hypothetical protein